MGPRFSMTWAILLPKKPNCVSLFSLCLHSRNIGQSANGIRTGFIQEVIQKRKKVAKTHTCKCDMYTPMWNYLKKELIVVCFLKWETLVGIG